MDYWFGLAGRLFSWIAKEKLCVGKFIIFCLLLSFAFKLINIDDVAASDFKAAAAAASVVGG